MCALQIRKVRRAEEGDRRRRGRGDRRGNRLQKERHPYRREGKGSGACRPPEDLDCQRSPLSGDDQLLE